MLSLLDIGLLYIGVNISYLTFKLYCCMAFFHNIRGLGMFILVLSVQMPFNLICNTHS